jgi:hypothetical protein
MAATAKRIGWVDAGAEVSGRVGGAAVAVAGEVQVLAGWSGLEESRCGERRRGVPVLLGEKGGGLPGGPSIREVVQRGWQVCGRRIQGRRQRRGEGCRGRRSHGGRFCGVGQPGDRLFELIHAVEDELEGRVVSLSKSACSDPAMCRSGRLGGGCGGIRELV